MITFCGYANNDVIVHVPRIPLPGDRVQATAVEQFDGGMAANAAVAASRMGADVRFAGAVGPDARSTEILAALERDGVDTSWAARDGFLSTAIVMVVPGGDRSIISQDDSNDAARLAAVIDRLDSAGGGTLFVDGYRAAMLPSALPSSISLCIDLDGCEDAEAARVACRLADHVIVGRAWWQNIFGVAVQGWAELARHCHTHLVLTDGERGWTLVAPTGDVVDEPAVPVDVVDTIGAGDCFGGTYIAFVDSGRAPVAAARLAGAAAALACSTAGPRGCPTVADLLDFTSGNQIPDSTTLQETS